MENSENVENTENPEIKKEVVPVDKEESISLKEKWKTFRKVKTK